MPYTIRKRSCRQSSGRKGKYVLSYTDKKGKKHSNCHTSRKKAQGQIAAIEGPREGVCEIHGEGCGCGISESISWVHGRQADFARNPYTRRHVLGDEAPPDEFEPDKEDPVGLLRATVRAELDRQIHDSRRAK